MAQLELEASKREEIGKKNKKVRGQGLIPAVVYGKTLAAQAITVSKKTFLKKVMESDAGMNAIISLKISGEKGAGLSVLTHDLQKDPLTDEIIHIDFRQIILDEMIKTKVPVELTGLPVGVKETGGVLVHGLREVEVECLPMDIPDKFEIDVAALMIGDSLHVSNLTIVAKVKILTNPSEMIANCSPPTKEEEVAAPVITPEEAAAAAAGEAVAEEEVKEKAAPGAAPAKEKPGKEAAPVAKTEKK